MVPEGWEVIPFSDVAEFKNGLNFNKDDDGRTIKVVGIPDFWQRTTLTDFSRLKTITSRGDIGDSHMLRSGDLLFVRSNGNPELVGRCMFFPTVNEPISFSGFTIRGRVDHRRMLPEFAASLLGSDVAKDQIRKGGGGTNISNLSQDILGGIPVVVPPLPEQQKIAEVLGVWDRAIATTTALLANARAQKRALMQTLLTGARRFPGFEDHPWREVRLGDVGTTYGGLTGKTKEHFGTGSSRYIPYLNIFQNNRIDPSQLISVDVGPMERQNRVRYGDVFFTTSSETPDKVGMSSVLLDELDDTCLNSFCFGFRPHDLLQLRPRFAQFFFRGTQFRCELFQLAQGATRYNLSKTALMNVIIQLPSPEEQDSIADILVTAGADETSLAHQLNHLRTEKKSLMQQLLTGKRRVVV